MAMRRFSFLLLLAVAGPVAAFGHYPAGRGSGALTVLVAFGELSLVRAAAVFICIAAAALVPWRLHDAVASRDDVRAINPVEAAAVSAVVAGMPDPAVLLDRARPRHPPQRRRRPSWRRRCAEN